MLVARAGMNPNSLATAAGYSSRSGIQRYFEEDGPFLSPRFILKIVDVLEGRGNPPIARQEVLELAEGLADNLAAMATPATTNLTDEFIPARRTLPVYGMAQGGDDGSFELNGTIADYVYRPSALEGVPDAYAVYMVGDSMEPRYEEGETLYIHPHRPTPPGSYVSFQVHAPDTDRPRALIKKFVKRDNGECVFEQLNPPKQLRFRADSIVSMHKILMSGDH